MKKIMVPILLLGFSMHFQNASGDPTEETPCFKIYSTIVRDPALSEDAKSTIEKWSLHKEQCEKTGEYEMYLADIYCSDENYKQCRSIAEEIIKKKGRIHDVRVAERLLNVVDSLEGNLESLKNRSKAMIQKYPDWYEGYQSYGSALFNMGHELESKKYFEKANSLEENVGSLGYLAFFYYLQHDDYKKTIELYKKALNISASVLLMPRPTLATIDSAMQLGRWNFAEILLDDQKKADASIVDHPIYKKLRLRMDAHIKEHFLE